MALATVPGGPPRLLQVMFAVTATNMAVMTEVSFDVTFLGQLSIR